MALLNTVNLNTSSTSLCQAVQNIMGESEEWWATKDLNLGPLPCEGSALTTELVARGTDFL
jgi:hypothetical protein